MTTLLVIEIDYEERCTSIAVVNGNLVATAEFAGADLSPMADQVFRLYEQGFMRAVSVGFRPLSQSTHNDSGGVDYGAVELLEFSCVPVPANPEALRKSLASHGGDVSEARAVQLIEQAVDRAGLTSKSRSANEATARRIIEHTFDEAETAAFSASPRSSRDRRT